MNQSEWIKEVFKHRPDGFDPYIETHFETENGLKYGSWNKYQGQKQVDERSVFPNEIIIDIDTENTEKAIEENRKVLTFLDSKGYDYILADTGGTGYHIHLFFKYPGIDLEQYREYRVALYEYLRAKTEEEVNADTQLWDDQPVTFDVSNSKGHLVRAIGGRKPETGHRKTVVNPSELKKKEIEDIEEVDYPERLPWMMEISKTGTSKADLSIQEIQEKVEEVKEQEEKVHDKKTEIDVKTKIKGIEDVRDIPASKVLDLLDIEYKEDINFECPFHADNNPSANLHRKDGVERLYCFSNSCAENSRVKVWNAVDILIDSGYEFKEAVKKLGEEFGIKVQIGFNPIDYYGTNVNGNNSVRPERLVSEIMEQYEFKNVIGEGFYVWKDNYWQELNEDNDLIGTEVDKRLQNETSARNRNNVRDMIKNREEVKVEKKDFKSPDKLIPFKNGVYDLEEDELVEHKPEYNFDFQYEVSYRPELAGENNQVQQFIETLMPESEEDQKKLREIAALCLAPWKINQKVPILYGQGSNGKNQFVKIIWKMLGEDSYHKTSARDLQQDTFEMASVVDKQMAFFDEFEDVSKPGQLKTLVGDEHQKVREMRKESYTVETSVYPIFAANELPNPSDDSDGFYRRWEIIDFKQKFTPEPDDGNPDRIPVKELEERYMNQEALDAFATTLIDDLKRLIKENRLTGQQTTEETRRQWMKKGNALYAFIDTYLAPGDLPEEDGGSTNDWIIKDELLDIVNNYMEANNNSEIKKHRLTRALDSHPDFRIWKTYRPETEDGSRPRAYAGLKLDEDHVPDVQQFLGFNAYNSKPLHSANELGKWMDIVDSQIVGKALIYLSRKKDHSASLFELVRELDMVDTDLPDLQDSKFLLTDNKVVDGYSYPVFRIDFDAIEEAPEIIDLDRQRVVTASDFVLDRIDSWSNDTRVEIQELIEKAEAEGLSGEDVEAKIEQLEDDGTLYEPEPGVVQKL